MATSLPFLNVTGISLPSSGSIRRRSYIVSRQDLPEFSAKAVSTPRLSVSPVSSSSSQFRNGSDRFLSPGLSSPIRSVTVRSQLNTPLISANDEWGTWTALFATGAFGLWSEKTKIGSAVSGALVSTLIGLAASNLGIISSEAPAFAIVLNFLLPLAVPLLLFRADLRRVVQSTGKLLLAFVIGSVATTIGTALAYYLVPMRALGPDSWKIAAALMGRHIGGAVNYVAIANALGVSPSVLAAGLAADNVICAVYFTSLFAIGSKIPAETLPPPTTDAETKNDSETKNKIPVLLIATGIAVSLAICKAGALLTKQFGISGGSLPAITAVVVVLATVFPSQFGRLAPSGEAMALILMQVFFTVIGASGNIWNVINTAPSIFLFALVQIGTHLAVILGIGKLLNIELRLLLLASNANVGGPTTAAGMATAKGWNSLIVPGILAGIFGIAIATFLGIAFGVKVLKFM
uniref:Putative membrane protein YjcL n=1 Tax=Noccaea caerulescens TaxID=107243 RepID=A0A1J3I2K9_NOCCA